MKHCISFASLLIAMIFTLSFNSLPAQALDGAGSAQKLWPGVAWSYIKLTAATGDRRQTSRPRGRQGQRGRDHIAPKAAVPDYPKWLITGKKGSARLSKVQAQKVLSLAKLTHGDVVLSKCPAVFRHFFEFFNQKDQMVAQIVVCFECDIVRISPNYFPIAPKPEYKADADGGDEDDWGPEYRNGVKALKGYASLVSALNLPFLSPSALRKEQRRQQRLKSQRRQERQRRQRARRPAADKTIGESLP